MHYKWKRGYARDTMTDRRKKRAHGVRNRKRARLTVLLAELSLAWLLLAPVSKPEPSAPCGVEANVLIERIGPKGTSAVA
jgi:hypothetical protein